MVLPQDSINSSIGDVCTMVSCWIEVSLPSFVAPRRTFCRVSERCPVPLNICLRVRFSFTGRPIFFAAIALFLLGYLGLVISTFPYIVPPALTIWDAAAAPASQMFMLVGTLILLPIILGYTGFIYWIFRGKVREGEGYH